MFDLFDANGDGKISPGELNQMMEKLGQTPSPEELKDIMKSADVDGKSAQFVGWICVVGWGLERSF